jgi:TIR domain
VSGVFISYRRDGAAMAAAFIHDQLAQSLGSGSLFLDSADLKPGDDWKNALDERVGSCSALLAVIGKTWVSPRLAEPSDVVRFEIETALHRDVRVIPVLVDGAEKLDEKQLPDSLKTLSNRQWVKIPNEKPEYGLNELSQLLSKVLRGIDNPEKSAPPTAAAPPGRTDERLGRIASAIDAAFGTAMDLDNLLVFTLGEELRDASLGNSSTGPGPTIDLVKALHAEGLLEQFLCCARMARPESKDLGSVIDECCPGATKPGEHTTEDIQAVLAGIECASRLRANKDVGAAVAERLGDSQKLLSGISRDLKKLKAYKTLHDVLQHVQIERYPFVVAQIKRLGEDPTVLDELGGHVVALRKLCIDAGNAVDALRDIGASFSPERSWLRTLSSAIDDLDAASEKLDRPGARGVALTIRDVLSKHSARMDYELRGTAESLRLDHLISTIAAVAAIRGLTEAEKAPLEAAKVKLQKLNGYLGGRVAVHNKWQDVENQLWAADEEFERTPSTI